MRLPVSIERRGAGEILTHDEALIQQGEYEAQGEQDDGDGAAKAISKVLNAKHILIQSHGLAGIRRTTQSQDIHNVEDLQRSDNREQDGETDGAAQQWKGDIARHLQGTRAVDACR